ncbi:phosphatase PAP2 family protein [Natronolimnohabitans innermongolicus]|uniref:PA-phosphatase-like phosphoesterase n=1 Tax=Natronolimnohabitans innermongolicus JCM 12255 TaxID=1227499 RepID=L9WQ49_9EURY|nr:phosphatase PAP2 family protein [Natronolimnohabitans innermongolicus]ELY51620.1 PA-phosphatase-like phosphoesterase [Natronolimnohabitans innermongolicus JCM 12255]
MFSGRRHPVLEPELLEAIVEAIPEWLGALLVPTTYIGSVFVIVPAIILAYWWAPDRLGALIPAFFAYYGLMASIKSLNSATRPDVDPAVGAEVFPELYSTWYGHATAISSTSFPSGNAMVPAVIIGLLIVDLRISTLRRRALVGGFAIATIGFTRLGLGVHYPIDVVGGIALGLGLVGVVLLCRRVFDDGVGAMFVVALVVAFASVWLRSNGFGVPTWDGIQGSNRVLAFGGAVGGLLAWRVGRATEWRYARDALGRVGTFTAVLAVVGVTYAIHTTITHPLVTMCWAAVAFGAIIALPHVVPTRDEFAATLGLDPARGGA